MNEQLTQAQLIGRTIGVFIVNPLIGAGLLFLVLPYSFGDCYILSFAIIWLVTSGVNASNIGNKK